MVFRTRKANKNPIKQPIAKVPTYTVIIAIKYAGTFVSASQRAYTITLAIIPMQVFFNAFKAIPKANATTNPATKKITLSEENNSLNIGRYFKQTSSLPPVRQTQLYVSSCYHISFDSESLLHILCLIMLPCTLCFVNKRSRKCFSSFFEIQSLSFQSPGL